MFAPGEGVPEEEAVVGEVAFEEAAGFAAEAVEPFEASFLDPEGCAADGSGVEVECGADGEVEGGGEAVAHGGEPCFLFGAAEANPDAGGAAFGDALEDVLLDGFVPCAEGRGVAARELGAGVAGEEFFAEGGEGLFAAAEEVVADVGGGLTLVPEFAHDVRSAEAVWGVAGGLAFEFPDDGHAVRADDVEVVEVVAVFLLAYAAGDDMGIRSGDEDWAVEGFRSGDEVGDELVHGSGDDGESEDVGSFERFGGRHV